MKSKTTEEFISHAKEVHGDKYLYQSAVYSGIGNKVSILCKVHGEFLQSPRSHVHRAQGCPHCGNISRSRSHKSNLIDFSAKANEIHGDKYDYTNSVYISATELIEIFCSKCQKTFTQCPSMHLSGYGCRRCAGVMPHTSGKFGTFADAARLVHGNKYSYDNVICDGNKTKVSIQCKLHGNFYQNISSHLSGSGCTSCATNGYSTGKAGSIYILKSGDKTKVGITNREVEIRIPSISKSSGFNFQIVCQIKFSDGWIPKFIESGLLRELKQSHQRVTDSFDGSTECFYDVDYDALVSSLVRKVSEAFGLRQH